MLIGKQDSKVWNLTVINLNSKDRSGYYSTLLRYRGHISLKQRQKERERDATKPLHQACVESVATSERRSGGGEWSRRRKGILSSLPIYHPSCLSSFLPLTLLASGVSLRKLAKIYVLMPLEYIFVLVGV